MKILIENGAAAGADEAARGGKFVVNRRVVRELNPTRKDPHWGKRKLKRDQ